MTTDGAGAPTEREVLVMSLGAEGRSRAEIALALEVSVEVLAAQAAEDSRLHNLLRAADGLALAWWEAQARDACEAGRFNLAGWGREMQRRFGVAPGRPDGALPAARTGRAPRAALPVTTIFKLPCNGKERRGPDGTCPCDECREKRLRRAERKALRAKSAERAARAAQDANDAAAGGGDDEET